MLEQLAVELSLKKSVYYQRTSTFPAWFEDGSAFPLADELSESYELIAANLPVGLRSGKLSGQRGQKSLRENWREALVLLNHLTTKGLGVILVEPLGFSGSEGKRFKEMLQKEGLFLWGYMETPASYAEGISTIRPLLALIGREERSSLSLIHI